MQHRSCATQEAPCCGSKKKTQPACLKCYGMAQYSALFRDVVVCDFPAVSCGVRAVVRLSGFPAVLLWRPVCFTLCALWRVTLSSRSCKFSAHETGGHLCESVNPTKQTHTTEPSHPTGHPVCSFQLLFFFCFEFVVFRRTKD